MRKSLQWASLHNHTDKGSLLDGLSKPIDLIKRCVETGIPAIGLSDHGSVASCVSMQKAKKKYGEEHPEAILPKLILGCEMYIADSETKNSHLVVLAKNKRGYQQLIKGVSEATRRENFYRKPRLRLDQLADYAKDGNLVSFNGHPGSSLNNILFLDLNSAFAAETLDEAKTLLKPTWKEELIELAGLHRDIFGVDNFFIEIQVIDQDRLPMETVAANCLRWLCKNYGYKPVSTCDSHYPTKRQAIDHRVLLCSSMRTTLPKVRQALANDQDVGLGGFFKSNKYYLPTPEEMIELHTEEELANSILISDMCEEYSLENKPTIPIFNCPDGLSSEEYMKELCRQGWKEKLSLSHEERTIYGNRVKHELEVLQGAGLSDYFLLVRDIIKSVQDSGGLIGPARGSVAGSLVAFLLGITSVDSIKYNLLFPRFYNAGRNSPGHISLPDIDIDIQASYRDRAINYIKEKYGRSKVGKIATYGRLMGRACLSEVLRVHDIMSFDEVKLCTKFLPDQSAIADDLEEMRENDELPSIILWSLQNNKKELKEWAYLDNKGNIQGPLASHFLQAIRLEGVYKSRGEHAAAMVIFPQDIDNVAPVIYDKSNNAIISYDMYDTEFVGGVKFDCLGVSILDRISDAQSSICNDFMGDI